MTHTPTTVRRTSTGVAVLLAAACAAALAFLIVGLAGVGKIPAADVPAAVAPAPVSVPATTAPTGPTNAEYRYLQIVNNGAPHAQSVMTQRELLTVGHTVCDLEADPANPLTRPQMANAIAENGVSLDDASLIVVAAEDEMC